MATKIFHNSSIAFILLVLIGCASNEPVSHISINQEKAFHKGEILLDCVSCSFKAGLNYEKMESLYKVAWWYDLSNLVINIGYGNDLTYFYLGRAAEGLDKLEAAKTYYQLSLFAHSTTARCDFMTKSACFGHAFPDEAKEKIAIIEAKTKSLIPSPPAVKIQETSATIKTQSNINLQNVTSNDVFSEKIDSFNEVKISKNGGLYYIPATINDVLKIKFIIDSGASEVSVSQDVAFTLIKTETITQNDLLPGQEYQLADGSISKSNRFIIRTLKIGNRILKDVACIISGSVKAPMLLGQSALEKLGNYSIDYKASMIRFQNKQE